MASQSRSTLRNAESPSGHRERRHRHRSPEEVRHRRRRRSTIGNEDSLHSSRARRPETRRSDQYEESSESEEDAATQSGSIETKQVKRKTRIVYVTEAEIRSPRVKERHTIETREYRDDRRHSEDSVGRSRAYQSRRASVSGTVSASPPKRRTSARDTPPEVKPVLKRSNTTTASLKPPTIASTHATHRRSSLLGGIFGPLPQQHREPEKLVECLTCLSDDIPRSKSAKLKCGHRMCNSCLRRIFKLSITDPQHMPPRCCTTDHIPLKHVEKLFDVNFKKTWNRKFQEYSTKNRIYCPSRRCGEWIKPENIHKENGKKYGKCSRCKIKVCCLCNGKWHGTKDCPKDEETNRLLETAREAGWQRCYNCRAMVELKEGCNHMTCRCTAEFCMVCGEKWKTCDCPWFNYETVEEDRLNHMRVPGVYEDEGHIQPIFVQQRPANYLGMLYQRRREERAAQEVLHRFERVTLEDNDPGDDYQGMIGEIHGIGNGAGHFMNENYIRAPDNDPAVGMDQAMAAANYAMGAARARNTPAGGVQRRQIQRPLMRRHTTREQAYNSAPSTRPSERVVPRRIRRDYASEAAVHAPAGGIPTRSSSNIERSSPSRSTLAGLRGNSRGSNRVSAWRRHVEPGVEPAEGVLSM